MCLISFTGCLDRQSISHSGLQRLYSQEDGHFVLDMKRTEIVRSGTTGPNLIYFADLEASPERVTVFFLSSFHPGKVCSEFIICLPHLSSEFENCGLKKPLSDDFAQTQDFLKSASRPVFSRNGISNEMNGGESG